VLFKPSLRRDELYHFKLLSLTQAQEATKSETTLSEIKLKFHFFHKLLSPFDMEGASDYVWAIQEDNLKHRIFLSKNGCKQMLELIQNRLAILWEREEEDDCG